MNKTKMQKKITELIEIKTEIGRMTDRMELKPEGTIDNIMTKTFDTYLQTLEDLIAPKTGWLAWFVWDNDCGNNGLHVAFDGCRRKIKTVKDLADIITENSAMKVSRQYFINDRTISS